jgi:hypothetical protein
LQIIRHGKSMTINLTPMERPVESAASALEAQRYFSWVATRPLDLQRSQALLLSQLATTPPNGSQWLMMPHAIRRQLAAAPSDEQAKMAAIEEHLNQLLKDVQAARQSLDEIRKIYEQRKEKPSEEKK